MAVVTTNLGVVTAYGDAVEGGYTGTKEQWQSLMADYGTIGTQAQQDAQTASQAAQTASQAAQTATQKASEASTSATQAQQAAASISTPDTTLTQSGKAADAKKTGDEISSLKEDFNDIINSAYVTDSASGAVAHFEDGADDVPMKSLKVAIEPVQSGSGDPSPDNVRPISGWNAVNVVRAGKNLLPNTAPDTITKSGVTATKNSDGSITLNGTATANVNFEVCGFDNRLMPFICKGQLTLTGCPAGGSTATYRLVAYLYKDGAYTGTFLNDTGGGSTVDADAGHIYSIISVYNGQTYNNLTFYPMIRLASDTDSIFEPYNGNTYDISLASAGTVYGGTLDVVSGELTVDKKMVTIDGSNYALGVLSGVYNNRYCYRNTYLGGIIEKNLPSETTNACCNMLKSISRSDATSASNGIFQYHGDNDELRFLFPLEDAYSTPDKIYALGLECCIPLATPFTYQLSAQQVTSLLGKNNVWSDAGDVDVEYRADTKLYIDKRLGV